MDPYKILGIPRNSTIKEIRTRYHCLVRKYHPDKNINEVNNEEAKNIIKKFQEIEYAYKSIINPESLKNSKPPPPPPSPPPPAPSPPPPPMPKFKKGQKLDDFLEELMKEGQKKTGKKKDKWF